MKKYIALLSLLVISIFYSCTSDEIDAYGDTNYVSFVKEIKDTTRFSFFFYPEDEVQYAIQVKLVGRFLTEETDFYISVDENKTTLDKELYSIPEKFSFGAGQLLDTIYIMLKNRPDLFTNKYLLKLDIEDGANISSARGIFGSAVLYVSDMAERPEWWTPTYPVEGGDVDWNSIEWSYLGPYSREKYEAFMEATGEGDLTGWGPGELRSICREFSIWLKEQVPARLEANGEPIEISIIG